MADDSDQSNIARLPPRGAGGGVGSTGLIIKQPIPQLMEADPWSFLFDVLRSHSTAYLPDGSLGSGPDLYEPVPRRSAKDDIELEINALIDPVIPPLPRNNRQRVHVLSCVGRAFLDNAGVSDAFDSNEETDGSRFDAIIEEIYAERPRMKELISSKIIASLYRDLSKYAQIAGVSERALPFTEVLAHRTDQRNVRAHGSEGDARRHSPPSETLETLRRINETLDRIVPDGAYYNKLRQHVVDRILERGAPAVAYMDRRSKQGGGRKKPRDFGRDYQEMIDLKRSLGRVIDAFAHELVPQKRLGRGDVLAIARAMQCHRDIVRADRLEFSELGEPKGSNFVPGEPMSIHRDLRASVERKMAVRQGIFPAALSAAERVVERLAEVVPATRANFVKRCAVLKTISSNRAYWLDPSEYDDRFQHGLHGLKTQYFRAWSEKPEEFERIARALDAYHEAFEGRSSRAISSDCEGTARKSEGPSLPLRKRVRLPASHKKAGIEPGQQSLDLFISRSRAAPASDPVQSHAPGASRHLANRGLGKRKRDDPRDR